MITIHCTKKLLSKLPIDGDGFLPDQEVHDDEASDSTNPLGSWHANLITLQKRNCVLFVHDTTCFPVFIKALTKPDFAELDWYFEDGFMNTLLKLDATQSQLDAAASCLQTLQFDNHTNRSTVGHMVEMAKEIEHMLWYDHAEIEDVSPNRTGVWLSHRLRSVEGTSEYQTPYKSMLELLDGITT